MLHNPDLKQDRTILRQLLYDPALPFPIPAKTRSKEDSLGGVSLVLQSEGKRSGTIVVMQEPAH